MVKGLFGAVAALLTLAPCLLGQVVDDWAMPPSPPHVDEPPALPEGDFLTPPPPWQPRFWIDGGALLLWLKGSPFPTPLAATTTDLTTQPIGAVGQSATTVLLGQGDLKATASFGARFNAGMWLDPQQTLAIEGGVFFIASQSVSRSVSANGQPNSAPLAVPFFDADAGAESSFLLAAPGTASGSASLSYVTHFQGVETNGLVTVCSTNNLRVLLLGGLRYLDLTENATFHTTSIGIQDPAVGNNAGLILNTTDHFDTRNLFFGWQVGARGEYQAGPFSFNILGKIAVGDSYQLVHLTGDSRTNFFDAPAGGPFTGVPPQLIKGSGIFVQQSNRGHMSRDQFAWAPEAGFGVDYQLTRRIHLFGGYQFLYLSSVALPGNQIDHQINFSQTVQSSIAGNVPTPGQRPLETISGGTFWAQGLYLGLEVAF